MDLHLINWKRPVRISQLMQFGGVPGDESDHITTTTGIIVTITMQADGSWLFEWPSTGDSYYRIVLQGEELTKVTDETNGIQQYVYDGPAFISYPPPLEIMPASAGLAPSEINKPFIAMQWYDVDGAVRYEVQELVSAVWTTKFFIEDVDAVLYTWRSVPLTDQTTHQYRVLAYNSIDQASDPLEFDIYVVTPPLFVETDFAIEYVGTDIVLDFVE